MQRPGDKIRHLLFNWTRFSAALIREQNVCLSSSAESTGRPIKARVFYVEYLFGYANFPTNE